MTDAPHQSLPKQCGSWADLKGAYRLLSNPAVDPHAIQRPHRRLTLDACAEHPVVLSVEDTTEIDLTAQTTMRHRGSLGNGHTRGLLQHAALAVVPGPDTPAPRPDAATPSRDRSSDAPPHYDSCLDTADDRLLGVLHQCWHQRTEAADDETLRELQSRRTDADVWLETASAVAELGDTPARLIHVGDRHSDMFRFFTHCQTLGHGFVVRARHDRALSDQDQRLWATMRAQPIAATTTLTIHEQRTPGGKVRRIGRSATLAVRHRAVTITPPVNDPRTQDQPPITLHAVFVQEQNPPEGVEPVSWMLLTSEPVADADDAWRIVRYYRHRWLIEEWHRVLKEGCGVEANHFDDARDVQRLAAIKGVIAARLLQLRDLADHAGDDPNQLQAFVPAVWITVVAHLAKTPPAKLTPKQFWLTLAKQGGYLARKRDPRPGWKTIWQGWYDTHNMVQGALLMQRGRCG